MLLVRCDCRGAEAGAVSPARLTSTWHILQGVCQPGDQGEDVQWWGAHVPSGWLHLLSEQPAAVRASG